MYRRVFVRCVELIFLQTTNPNLSPYHGNRVRICYAWRRVWDSNPRAQRANGFQDRLVMTTSISLHGYPDILSQTQMIVK